MKSLTAVCQTGASIPTNNHSGRIVRHPPHRSYGENAEIKMYLSKLKDLVPFMPKNRKLSKLEIIQHVIDYICDLQSELEVHPDIGNFNATSALNLSEALTTRNHLHNDVDMLTSSDRLSLDAVALERLQQQQQQQQQQQSQQQIPHLQQYSSPVTRQPLVDRHTPNTIQLSTTTSTSHSYEHYHHHHHHHQHHQHQHQHQHQQQQQILPIQQTLPLAVKKDRRTEPC